MSTVLRGKAKLIFKKQPVATTVRLFSELVWRLPTPTYVKGATHVLSANTNICQRSNTRVVETGVKN